MRELPSTRAAEILCTLMKDLEGLQGDIVAPAIPQKGAICRLGCGTVVKKDSQQTMWTNYLAWYLYLFRKACEGFSPTCRRSMHGRVSNHAAPGHKKRCTPAVEIHYNTSRHEPTPRGGGLARVAGQSCLAGPSVLRLHPYVGHMPGWGMVREARTESQAFFCPLGMTRRVSAAIPPLRLPSPRPVVLVQTEHGEC